MSKRASAEINAGSMADIAFLLLIFFLVTTTMDVDAGITRKLPPIQDEPLPNSSIIHQRNIFTVLVNAQDKLMVEGELMALEDLRKATREFLNNNGDGTCEYCLNAKQSPGSSDNPQKAVVSLQNDRGTSYKLYIAVQNELAAAYNELREDMAQKRFGTPLKELSEAAQEEIKLAWPQKISEAEPVNL